MPWNDTAQLNYLDASTREAVIQTILHVARKFPIIRFDAAMTLAKQHIQRLWFPQPGHGGAIPSRSEHGMTREEFDRLIPNEFWREVVDRVAAEVPDTLLLAEAFWMLEGYFVRTLGMHRVYNSAFMHMTSKEDNSEYRRLIKNTIEFDPQILQRYVNFMNNPDEETAVAQFGKDDKYVGVATLMATMPGLPMFGHGQVEGFSERYGMEFRKARWDEEPDDHLIERHRRELFPLLHRRRQFAGAENFRLYDVVTEHGDVNDNVFAYSNRGAGRSSLVLYNNAYERATGWIRVSSPFVVKTGEESRTQTDELAAALGLRAAPGDLVRFREIRTGLEYLRRSEDIARHGFFVQLDGYQSRVFLDFEELHDAEAHLHALAEQLGGGGVPSLRVAVDAQLLQPLRDGFGDFIDALLSPDGDVPTVRHDLVDELDRYDCDLDASSADFLDVAHGLRDDDLDRLVLARVRTALPEIGSVRYRLITAAALIAARMSCRNGAGTEAALRDAVAARLGDQPGLASLVPAVASHYRWAQRVDREPLDEALRATLDGLTSDPDLAPLIGVHEHEDRLWFNRERYEDLVTALTTAAVVTAPSKAAAKRAGNVARELLRAAERAGYDWEALATKAT